MSEKERAIQIIENIPEDKMVFVVNMLENIREMLIEEVEPDKWDLAMIEEAKKENDGHGIPIEDLAAELGIKL